MKKLTAVDLFAGLGGNSEGAKQASVDVIVAANHWPLAVEMHRINHPEADHLCQDLQQANFHAWPDFDIMLASPACQGHSRARGKDRPHHDATRSTAWAVVACAEAKRPKFVVVENVADYVRWPLYPQWKSCLETLGYVLSENVLDAADLGVPQTRKRLFIVGVRKDVSPTPIQIAAGTKEHRPAWSVLGHDGSWSNINKPGRAQATLNRIDNGRRAYGQCFLVAYFGSETGGRTIHKPLGTVLTRDRYALVQGDRMRMLTAPEYRRAMGFPETYRLPEQHKLAVHLLGNSVCPAVMAHVIETIKMFV